MQSNKIYALMAINVNIQMYYTQGHFETKSVVSLPIYYKKITNTHHYSDNYRGGASDMLSPLSSSNGDNNKTTIKYKGTSNIPATYNCAT
jgi:hypothetical protein